MPGPWTSQVARVQSFPDGLGIATITVDASALPTGVYSLALRTAAGLEVRRDEAFILLPHPTVTSLDESLFCDPHMFGLSGGTRSEKLGINGTNLYRLPPFDLIVAFAGRGPSATLRPTIVPDAVSGCRAVPFSGGESCFLSTLGLFCNRFEGAELCTRVEAGLPGADLSSHMTCRRVSGSVATSRS